jgi:hypothetical protein
MEPLLRRKLVIMNGVGQMYQIPYINALTRFRSIFLGIMCGLFLQIKQCCAKSASLEFPAGKFFVVLSYI